MERTKISIKCGLKRTERPAFVPSATASAILHVLMSLPTPYQVPDAWSDWHGHNAWLCCRCRFYAFCAEVPSWIIITQLALQAQRWLHN